MIEVEQSCTAQTKHKQPPSLDKQNISVNLVTIVNGERYQSHLNQ